MLRVLIILRYVWHVDQLHLLEVIVLNVSTVTVVMLWECSMGCIKMLTTIAIVIIDYQLTFCIGIRRKFIQVVMLKVKTHLIRIKGTLNIFLLFLIGWLFLMVTLLHLFILKFLLFKEFILDLFAIFLLLRVIKLVIFGYSIPFDKLDITHKVAILGVHDILVIDNAQ